MYKNSNATLIALNRFAFGARGSSGDLARAASDPRGYLTAELVQPAIADLTEAFLPSTKAALQTEYAYQELKKMELAAASPPSPANVPVRPDTMNSGDVMKLPPADSQVKMAASPDQEFFKAEAMARFRCVLHANVGYVEQLVHFWSNHFCVSVAKSGLVRATAGAFEREAIRPHVLGRFSDMLLAVTKHPAMLHYLDNVQSIGPNSKAGQKGKRGLNENLARELLELHTLGVDGGYSQADVTSLARILTGWSVVGAKGARGEPGTYVFFENGHEPGDQMLIGKLYPANGEAQGEAALRDFARHPSTAKHLALKLAQHFVADDPPKALVGRLAGVYTQTDGDLKAMAIALVESDEAWSAPLTKMRTPEEFILSATRALDRIPDDPGPILGPLRVMGQPLWQPPGPNGWSDMADVWSSPEGMKSRLDVSAALAGRVKELINPSELLDAVAGDAASAETRQAVSRAESRQQGLALLFMSPEFQRR